MAGEMVEGVVKTSREEKTIRVRRMLGLRVVDGERRGRRILRV